MANNVAVTNRGFEYIAQYLAGQNPGSTVWPQPLYVGWGTAMGSNATTVVLPAASNQSSDVAPYSEAAEARVSGTASVTFATAASTAVAYQLTATITSGSGQSIGESFIAMAPAQTITKGQAVVGVGAPFTSTGVSMTVTSVSGLPTAFPYQVQAGNEVVNVTSAASTVLTVTRAYNGSAQNSNSIVAGQTVTTGNCPGSGPSNPHTADTFAKAGFVALALNSGDSVAFTWQVGITVASPSFT